LWHLGHRHQTPIAEPSNPPTSNPTMNPGVADDLEVMSVPMMAISMPNSAMCIPRLAVSGMAQALQSEDEKDRSEQVTKFDEVGLPDHKRKLSWCFGLCALSS
jgi:hypothetical protein